MIANNSEETLKLLIQEYHSRLALIESGYRKSSCVTPEANDDLRSENRLLLEQLQRLSERTVADPTVPLLQFALADKDEVGVTYYQNGVTESATFPQEGQKLQDLELAQRCVEAVKLKCKQTFLAQRETSQLRKLCKNLQDAVAQQIKTIDTLKTAAQQRDAHIAKMKEVIQDQLKILKAQAAKLEVYESPDKWLPNLTPDEASTFIVNFQAFIDRIRSPAGAGKSGLKLLPGTTIYYLIAKLGAASKLSINTKHTEAYVTALVSQDHPQATVSQVDIPVLPKESVGAEQQSESESETLKCVKQIQERIFKLQMPEMVSSPTWRTLKRDESITKSNATITDYSGGDFPSTTVFELKNVVARPKSKSGRGKKSVDRTKPSPSPRNRNSKSALNGGIRSSTRSTSSCSKKQQSRGNLIELKQSPSPTARQKSPRNRSNNLRNHYYQMGPAFSPIHCPPPPLKRDNSTSSQTHEQKRAYKNQQITEAARRLNARLSKERKAETVATPEDSDTSRISTTHAAGLNKSQTQSNGEGAILIKDSVVVATEPRTQGTEEEKKREEDEGTLLMQNVLEMAGKPGGNVGQASELKALQNIVNQMYMT